MSINGNEVKDIIDYKYLVSDDYILLEILKPSGEVWEYEIEKDYHEDLGIIFTNPQSIGPSPVPINVSLLYRPIATQYEGDPLF